MEHSYSRKIQNESFENVDSDSLSLKLGPPFDENSSEGIVNKKIFH